MNETKEINDTNKTLENHVGLDDEQSIILYVYIKHIGDSTIHKVSYLSAMHSKLIREFVMNNTKDSYGKNEDNPLIIPYTIKLYTMQFMIDYMNYMNCKNETPAPISPIHDIHLSVLFKEEYKLFKDLHQLEKGKHRERILEINDYIISAMYFNFEYLYKKLAAVIASIFKNLSVSELESMKNVTDEELESMKKT
jgi:hypothetical protein